MDNVKEIFSELDRLKGSKENYSKKAKKFALFLKGQPGCSNIEVLDCDVCVTDFFPGFFEKLGEIYGPVDMGHLLPEEREKVHQKMDNEIPNAARVRVHADVGKEKLTFCFSCDSTMCGNSLDYSSEVDWDREHEGRAMEILGEHPEWGVRKFGLCGSTRNRICLDVISDNAGFEFCQFDLGDGTHVSVSPFDRQILARIPEIEDKFKTIEYK